MTQPPSWKALSDEALAHIEERAHALIESGIPETEAWARAHREFGNATAIVESSREVWRWRWLDQFRQDVNYGLRTWRKAPGFALLAILTLTLGIAAGVAVFSVVDPLLFRRLPYPNDRELVSFGYFGPIDTNEFAIVSSYLDWRKTPGPMVAMTSMRPGTQCDLVTAQSPIQVPCSSVESNFLDLLGVAPVLGRMFTREEDVFGRPEVALISYRLWRGTFGGDPAVLNREITIDSDRARILGVLPPDFELPQLGEVDVLRPARLRANLPRAANSSGMLRTFGRLRPGWTVEQARRQMEPVMAASGALDVPAPLRSEVRYVLRSLRERRIHDVATASWTLFGAVIALLAISCSNVANLLIARAAARAREFAIRASVGAGRGRLLRQSLTESFLLGAVSCAAGCLIGWLALRLVVNTAPNGLLDLSRARFHPRVAAFATLATLTSVLIFGLLPVLHIANASGKAILRKALVAGQIALAMILLSGATLLFRSLTNVLAAPLGFTPEHVVTASFTLRQQRYASPAVQAAFVSDLERRLANIAPDSPFALTDSLPPRGSMGRPYSNIRVADRPPLEANGGLVAFRRITPGYFRALQIPIIAGRGFAEADRSDGSDPVILSASLAAKMFPDGSSLGRQIIFDEDGHPCPVIGVAADARNNGVTEPLAPEYYRLRALDGRQAGRTTIAVFRTSLPAESLVPFIRREISALDPALPVDIGTLDDRVRGFQQRPRFLSAVLAAFASVGLLLAAGGLCSVLWLLVAQRTKEIGIRSAIGARPRDIVWLFQGEALTWTMAGLAVGLAGSLMLARSIQSLLFAVSAYDPVSLAAAALVLIVSAIVAAWLPSRRASMVDPATTLRQD